MSFFRVAALDLDGTLTSHGTLSHEAMAGVAAARESGLVVLLVTGRIHSELEADHPGLAKSFDGMVLENGAVAVLGGRARRLAPPVDPALSEALHAEGVPHRRGEVLLAVDGEHSAAVARVLGELGLDHQLVHNRAAAMVLPAGVTKGSGLVATLRRINLSPRNTIAVGDAENDLSLLEAAEVGVAVGNAVPSLRRRADLVLDEEDGGGVAALLTGPVVSGVERLCPPRRWVDVGSHDDGTPARVPGAQAKILVTGPTRAGKSYVVGLMAERWIEAGYSVLVVDPEGDHVGLGDLDDVHVVDAGEHLPAPMELFRSMMHPLISVVLDMSALAEERQRSYLGRLRTVADAHRAQHGVPHWVVLDEAHLYPEGGTHPDGGWMSRTGYCLASYLPDRIPATGLEATDVVVRLPGVAEDELLSHGVPRWGSLRIGAGPERRFRVAVRRTSHVRHRHKYAERPLPWDRRFHFHTPDREPVVAGTLHEFGTAVKECDPAVLEFHLARGDMSRWLCGTIADEQLGARVAALEEELAARRAADIERVREQLVRAVADRYLEDGLERVGRGA